MMAVNSTIAMGDRIIVTTGTFGEPNYQQTVFGDTKSAAEQIAILHEIIADLKQQIERWKHETGTCSPRRRQ